MTAASIPFDRRAIPKGVEVSDHACADGWRLRRLDWPTGGAGDRRLLFLTGRADFAEKYLEAMAHWQARGWRVTSFDWRGQGGSRQPGQNEAALDDLLDDLDGFVTGWMAEGQAPAAVVAHSMGGHLTLRLMLERGWRPAAAVLVAPMLGLAAGPIPPALARGIAAAAVRLGLAERPIVSDRGRLRESLLTSSAERLADATWWRDANPGYSVGPPRWGWLDAAFRSIAAQEAALAALPADLPPMLVLTAGREHLVSNKAVRAAAARVGATIRHFPGARHEILREADPIRDAALAAVDGFLDAAVAA
ncbi:alpha/beta hydrolase [Sphingomonas jatrophae]|uniref:Lysophospholipase n=1 Tax=Sphingomonas jatrophae TaxID=1166337 RepID=A0A1I6JU89_9SPHN|nr:alpha/beta hydrolase [Sphingomonas jatrophae]SFR82501.1 lysophospholipase [Sphingomonas jatrophae]